MQTIIDNPVFKAALAGAVIAAAIDIEAFRSWKSFDDALSYDWRKASFRWFQGAVLGALAWMGVTSS